MLRFKQVLLATLAEYGAELPIPDALHVRTSSPTEPPEVRTLSADAPILSATRVRNSSPI